MVEAILYMCVFAAAPLVFAVGAVWTWIYFRPGKDGTR